MGSAASTAEPHRVNTEEPSSVGGNKVSLRESTKASRSTYSSTAPAQKAPNEETSSHARTLGPTSIMGANAIIASELNDLPLFTAESEEKPVAAMSNNKLKKMALGIQGYKDQQRDYDETLNTLDVNKTSQIQWSEPKPEETHGSPVRRPVVPPSPNKANHSASFFNSPSSMNNNAGSTNRTPLHTPTQSQYGQFSNTRTLERATPHNSSSSPLPSSLNSSARELPTVASFSRGGAPPAGFATPLTPGPPANIPARPFPRPSDADDLMYATFGSPAAAEVDSLKAANRPQSVPMLSFPPSSSGAGPRGPPGGSGAAPVMMTLQPRPFATPVKGGAPFPGGSPPPRAMTPMRPGFPSPGPGMAPFVAGPRATPASPAVPVVKETTVVKRNKVDLPTNMNHAKPTAGDWLNKRYFVNNYILLDTLGVGSYGEVRMCKDRNTEKLYAMKIISKDFLKKKKQGKSDETYFEDIKREIAIMKKLLHPNILRLFEVLDDPKVNKMYLLLEYMKRGDLINVLKKRGGTDPTDSASAESQFSPLSDFEVWNITRQLVAGVRYLHFQNIIHGDIKPQNLLLGEDGIVKVADFGISKMLSASSQQLQDAGGTPAFMSPELIENQTTFSGQLADVWAMGATVFMLRFGRPPWVAKSIINLYHKICNEPLVFPAPLDPGLQNLLEGMLEKDPQQRLSIPQIVLHPWYLFPPSNAVAKPGTAASKPGTASSSARPSSKQPGTAAAANPPLSFQPPESYESEEAAAMNKPPNQVDPQDLFMSIGGGATRVRVNEALRAINTDEDPFASTVDDIDLDEDDEDEDSDEEREKDRKPPSKTSSSSAKTDQAAAKGDDADVMRTNWGADVFDIIEEDVDVDDDDDDDEQNDAGDGEENAFSSQSKKKTAKGVAEPAPIRRAQLQHNEMSEEEEARRSKQFLKKNVVRKSSQNLKVPSSPPPVASASPSPVKMRNGAVFFPQQNSNASLCDGDTEKVVTVQFDSPKGSQQGKPRKPPKDAEEDDDADPLHEDFHQIMDTLSQQNAQQNSRDAAFIDEHSAATLTSIKEVTARSKNLRTSVGCAMHSEIGVRTSQEDCSVLLADVSMLQSLNQLNLSPSVRDQLSSYSLACLFDGHNGARTAQHVAQHLPSLIVTHDGFLNHKRLDVALMDACSMMDFQVCQMLAEEEDGSGATALIAVYDGKRQTLTVAGLGDSLCVLSRSGKAVEMNAMHRLNNAAERERVIRSGGKVMGNRVNGVLAVSRAFGDTQFKSPSSGDAMMTGTSVLTASPALVIAEPEVRSEVVTPKTEFAILATDGLWDVMGPQLAVTYLRSRLLEHHDLQKATKELAAEALSRGSVDNVSVIVLTFNLALNSK